MAPEVRRISEATTEIHALSTTSENPAPETLDERGFHLWLRDLYGTYSSRGLLLSPLRTPTEQDTLHSFTSVRIASHLLRAAVILETEFSLRPPADYDTERARAWRRTDLRRYDNVAPVYRAREINAGREVLRISAQHDLRGPQTPLIKSTATLRTTTESALEVAEVEVLVGSHTPFRELLSPNEDGFIRHSDIQRLLGNLAQDSQTLLAA